MELDQARVLIVEDDPHDVELIQLALAPHDVINYIDVVDDGEQALDYLIGADDTASSQPLPRLVLLDLKLPRIPGIQVLKAIREHPRTRSLVVVVMTSSQEDKDLQVCYDLGVNSYIVKPLDFQQFMDVARQVGLYWMLLNKPALPSFT